MRSRALIGVAAGLSALTLGAGIASAQSDDTRHRRHGGRTGVDPTDDSTTTDNSATTDDSTRPDREGCEDAGGGAGGPDQPPERVDHGRRQHELTSSCPISGGIVPALTRFPPRTHMARSRQMGDRYSNIAIGAEAAFDVVLERPGGEHSDLVGRR